MTIIAGSRLSDNQHIWVGLTRIFGIGKTRALIICNECKLNPETKVRDLKEDQIEAIRHQLTASGWELGTTLKRMIGKFISIKKMIRSYQGRRHVGKLPVRGQNTQKNAKTARKRRDS